MFGSLNSKFDVEGAYDTPMEPTAVVPATTEAVVEKATTELQNNDKLSTETLQELVQQGREAVTMMLAIAQNTEHPRAFEVLSQLLKTVADNAKDLLEVEKKRAEINKLKNEKANAPAANGPRTQNNLFIGSTTELLKAMQAAKLQEAIPEAEVEPLP